MKNFDYVQYGCGLTAPSHWRNFDASPTLQIEKLPLLGYLYSQGKPIFPNNVEYGDIVKGLPIPSNSCKAVYCSHVLEHLAFDDFNVALQNTFKILQPGAAFRFVLPDLEYYARQYLNSDQSDAALTFMKDTGLGIEYRPKGVKGFIRSLFGNSVHYLVTLYIVGCGTINLCYYISKTSVSEKLEKLISAILLTPCLEM
jgi:SAM-dependent methyltransferase